MGIEATIDDVVTSAVGSAVYFVRKHPNLDGKWIGVA
jgi:hypothetical protein